MGVSVNFKVALITDEVDEGHLKVIVIGIRIVAVLDKSDLRVTSGMSGGDGPVLFETKIKETIFYFQKCNNFVSP